MLYGRYEYLVEEEGWFIDELEERQKQKEFLLRKKSRV